MSLIDLSFTKLTPPIITLGNATVKDIVDAVQAFKLTTKEKETLTAIKSVLEKRGESYCSAEQVGQYLGKGAASVRYNLKSLVQKKVFTESSCKCHPVKVRKAALFIFNASYFKDGLLHEDTSQKDMFDIKSRDAIKGTVVNSYDYILTDGYGLSENIICKYLFSLLDYNRKESKGGKVQKHSGHIYLYDQGTSGEPIWVDVVSESTERIALVRDIRYYLAVLKVCEQQMDARVRAHGAGDLDILNLKSTVFEIPEADLLFAACRGGSKTDRQDMLRSMNRLDGTKYYLRNTPKEVMEKLGLSTHNLKLGHFTIIDYRKSNNGRISYLIEMGQYIVNDLYDHVSKGVEKFRRVDPRLFTETKTLRFALVLVLSHQIGGRIANYNWERLHDAVCPRMRRLEFKLKISKLLQDNALILGNDNNEKEKCFTWMPKEKELHSCRSVINDIAITYSYETGFIIQRQATESLVTPFFKRPSRKRTLNIIGKN